MKQFISIIIPTYKRAFVLKHVLESIKKQTYKFFELIVVYKPGGDETEEILNKYNKNFDMKIVPQRKGFFLDALDLLLLVCRSSAELHELRFPRLEVLGVVARVVRKPPAVDLGDSCRDPVEEVAIM